MRACNSCEWVGEDDECVSLGTVLDLCPSCKETTCEADDYGNKEGDIKYCCYPDCGCDGARLCMAEEGPNFASNSLNIEKGSM